MPNRALQFFSHVQSFSVHFCSVSAAVSTCPAYSSLPRVLVRAPKRRDRTRASRAAPIPQLCLHPAALPPSPAPPAAARALLALPAHGEGKEDQSRWKQRQLRLQPSAKPPRLSACVKVTVYSLASLLLLPSLLSQSFFIPALDCVGLFLSVC